MSKMDRRLSTGQWVVQARVSSIDISDSLLKGSGAAPSVAGGNKRTGGPNIQRAALRVLLNILLPLYGVLFTLIFFSVGLNNYHHPDIRDKMFC